MSQIEIRNLTKRYGVDAHTAAVEDLTLDVAAGEFVTLLGPSGCGKTTTLRLIAGYLAPDSGTISVSGQVLSSVNGIVPPERRGMGMVFQNYAVWPHKNVYGNVAFGLNVRKVGGADARERVARVLDLVSLSGLENRFPHELSGGQQQRVALARSLVVEPAILLLDEPLSNLDAKLREHMRSELKALQRRTAITFVYVTHDQAEALALSDRIAVIYAGRLQQYGAPRDVYRRPANRVVADFMGLINVIPARIAGEESGRRGIVEAGPFRVVVELPDGMRRGDQIDLAIRPESVRLTAGKAVGSDAYLGRIEEQSYLGNMNEYVVSVGEQRLRVQADSESAFSPGDSALVTIDGSACNVFKAQ